MLFQENDLDDGFVFVLIVFARLDFLQEISGLRTVLSDKPCGIAYEKFTAFVAEFSSSNMSVVLVIVKFGENFFEGASHQVIDSNVVGGEQEYGVSVRADPEVKDIVELVYLL